MGTDKENLKYLTEHLSLWLPIDSSNTYINFIPENNFLKEWIFEENLLPS